ncbi:MAG: hypothetical protein NZ518_04240, partial [Dehalococcoidia bacterium]|nr:hypothetical protein [Dehalococcoidia bacterium]
EDSRALQALDDVIDAVAHQIAPTLRALLQPNLGHEAFPLHNAAAATRRRRQRALQLLGIRAEAVIWISPPGRSAVPFLCQRDSARSRVVTTRATCSNSPTAPTRGRTEGSQAMKWNSPEVKHWTRVLVIGVPLVFLCTLLFYTCSAQARLFGA